MDPYKVLGISPTASNDEIKRAYKNILEEYSLGNSSIDTRPLAEDVIKDANMAYDILTNGAVYKEIRSYIDSNNIAIAESKLNLLDLKNSAEWNYLMGFVYFKKGWFDIGVQHIVKSIELDPGNKEYEDTLTTLRNRSGDIINYYKQNNYQNPQQPNQGNQPQQNNMNMCGGGNNMGGGMC
ncbi:J domain-containing protein [Clostridium nigeriense]|uniref:J domain-containing protein n=1 Tax=Clostridium nigeriense TaxID=1805470 RepID=UPI00083615CD|nr:DnaJ domain-containing protein [Clostridium nigeriense]